MQTMNIQEQAKAAYLRENGWVEADGGWMHINTDEDVYDQQAALDYLWATYGEDDVLDDICQHAIRIALEEGVKAGLEAASHRLDCQDYGGASISCHAELEVARSLADAIRALDAKAIAEKIEG